MNRVLQHASTFRTSSPSSSPSSSMPAVAPKLMHEYSSTPAEGTVCIFSQGKFTLSKARTHHNEDDIIFETLSKCLTDVSEDRTVLIDNSNSSDPRRQAMNEKVSSATGICGEGLPTDFIIASVSRKNQGCLLWEKGGAIVGIITYRYRARDGDVYIDALCMNKLKNYSGGSQLLKFFIDCLRSSFNKFCLTSVEDAVKFYERFGFKKYGALDGDNLQPMVLNIPSQPSASRGMLSRLAESRVGQFMKSMTPSRRSTTSVGDNAGNILRRNQSKHKRRERKRGTRKRGTRKRGK